MPAMAPELDRTTPADEDGPEPMTLFDTVLLPHRSLSPRGFLLVMALVAAISFAAGLAFLLHGAWPVFGFFCLDVVLVYIAFRASYRSANQYEAIRLTRETLTVERMSPAGRLRRWHLQPYWLRVEIDEPARHDSRLTLRSHGRTVVVGRFLAPAERAALAVALRAALAHLREVPLG